MFLSLFKMMSKENSIIAHYAFEKSIAEHSLGMAPVSRASLNQSNPLPADGAAWKKMELFSTRPSLVSDLKCFSCQSADIFLAFL